MHRSTYVYEIDRWQETQKHVHLNPSIIMNKALLEILTKKTMLGSQRLFSFLLIT